jgi:hypothetical protein
MNFPIDDWQFWVALIAFAVALWWFLRPLFRRSRGGGSCHCSYGPSDSTEGTKTTLTIEGKRR